MMAKRKPSPNGKPKPRAERVAKRVAAMPSLWPGKEGAFGEYLDGLEAHARTILAAPGATATQSRAAQTADLVLAHIASVDRALASRQPEAIAVSCLMLGWTIQGDAASLMRKMAERLTARPKATGQANRKLVEQAHAKLSGTTRKYNRLVVKIMAEIGRSRSTVTSHLAALKKVGPKR